MKKILSILCVISLCLSFNIRANAQGYTHLYAGATDALNEQLFLAKVDEIANRETDTIVSQEEIYDYSQVGYVTCNLLNVRPIPSLDSEVVDQLIVNTEVHYSDYDDEWAIFLLNNEQFYIYKSFLSETKKELNLPLPQHLTRSGGIFWGPNGKETYYNLNMSGVINIMRSIGNTDSYWVRDDGVKMLGDYVMIAADLNSYPRGSHVMTSLGMAVVCDTGDFVYNGSGVSFDIAVTW